MIVIFTIIHIFGLVTMGCSGLMATSWLLSYAVQDGASTAFWHGTIITLFSGALMFFPTMHIPKKSPGKPDFC